MSIGSSTEAVLKIVIDSREANQSLLNFNTALERMGGPAGIAKAALEGLGQATQFWIDQVEKGGQIADVFDAAAISIDRSRTALRGQVDDLTLQIAANRATQAGLELTAEEFANVTVVAKQYADATQQDVGGAIQQLVGALVTGRERGLRPFGLELDANGSAMDAVARKAKLLGEEVLNAGDRFDQARSAWKNFADGFAEGSASNTAFNEGLTVISELVSASGDASDGAKELGAAFTGAVAPAIEIAGHLARLNDLLLQMASRARSAAIARLGLQDSIGEGEAPDRPLPGATTRTGLIAPNEAMDPRIAARIRAGIRTAPNAERTGGGGGGGGRPIGPFDPQDTYGEARQAEENARELGQRANKLRKEQAEVRRIIDDQSRFQLDQTQQAEQIAYEATIERIRAERQARRDAADDREQLYRNDKARFEKEAAMQVQMTSVIGGAAKQGAKLFGAGKGALLAIDGVYETVQAAIAWANVANPLGGQAWIPTAVAHSAAAAMAFAEAAALGGGSGRSSGRAGATSGGSGGSAAFAPRTGLADTGGGGPVNVTVVMGPGGVVMGMDDDTLRRLGGVVREAQRRGHA